MTEVTPFPFASITDLQDRWPGFPTGSESHAAILLEDASQYILDVCPTAADAPELTRRRVTCAVVRRAMHAENMDSEGMESMQVSTGPHSMSFKPSNPHGDFYLTRQEKIALGHGRQVAFTVSMANCSSVHEPWCDLMFGATICSCGALL